jgi:hypothetical protein
LPNLVTLLPSNSTSRVAILSFGSGSQWTVGRDPPVKVSQAALGQTAVVDSQEVIREEKKDFWQTFLARKVIFCASTVLR